MDIGLTLKNCGCFNESEVGPPKRDGGHQETEGFNTRYLCSFIWLDVETSCSLRNIMARILVTSAPSALVQSGDSGCGLDSD